MKYWLLTTEFPPLFGGGISTYCYFTAKMLAAKGHEVSVFINDDSVKDIAINLKDGYRTIRFNPTRTKSYTFLGHTTNISYEFAHIIKHFVDKEGSPELIEAQEYLGIAYYLLQYKHLCYEWCKGITILITMHSPAFLYLEYNHTQTYKYPEYWIGEMERFSIQAADFVISPSKYLIDEVGKRLKYGHQNFYTIPNPYEANARCVIQTDTLNAKIEIVYFGKLSPQKGTFSLLHYFAKLWDNGLTESLTLIGGQDIVYHPEGLTMGNVVKKRYKKYIQNGLLKLEDKILPSEIENRLACAKVVIIPSTVDNLPYVVMEMMNLGLVVIVSKQGGQAEIIENEVDGFVFDHDNSESFEITLLKALNLSSERRIEIANNAVNKIRSTYSLEFIYEQKIKVVKQYIRKQKDTSNFPFIRKLASSENSVTKASINGLLSIVIPYYNMGDYIEETVNSIIESTIKYYEIIIINDGSTDEISIAKLNSYRENPLFRVIDIPNQGLANARNVGAEFSRGEYLAFLDADDKISPTYYEKAVRVLSSYKNVHFVGAWTQYFEGSNNVWPTFTPEPPLILFHNLVNSSSLIYKRSSFIKAGKNDGNMPFKGLEDYDSVISMIGNGYNGVVLPEILFEYRVRRNSMIRDVSNVKKILIYEYINNKHQGLYTSHLNDVLNLTIVNGSGITLDNPSLDFRTKYKFLMNKNFKKAHLIIKRNKTIKDWSLRVYNFLTK